MFGPLLNPAAGEAVVVVAVVAERLAYVEYGKWWWKWPLELKRFYR
jgi:hypothetical protein